MEELRHLERTLLQQLESLNLNRGKYYENHQEVALNSTHFLRLYQESSQHLFELLQQEIEECAEKSFKNLSQHALLTSISETFLQDLHDCLHDLEYHKATLLLWFGRRNITEMGAALDYFEFKFKIQLWDDCLQNSFSPAKALILATLCKEPADVEFKDINIAAAIGRLTELKSTNYSESSLNDFKSSFSTSMISVQNSDSDFLKEELNYFLNALVFHEMTLTGMKTALSNFIISQLKEQISVEDCLIYQLKAVEPDLVHEIDSILNERRQVQREATLTTFKNNLPSLFDKIFKDLQLLIKSPASPSTWLKHEKIAIPNVSARLSVLALPEGDVTSILNSFTPSVSNKVSIIDTMLSNQLKQSRSHQNSANIFANFYSLVLYLIISLESNALDQYVTEIILKPILNYWYSAVEECFYQFRAEFDYELAACFISDFFILSEALPVHREELNVRLSLNISQPGLLHMGIIPISESIPKVVSQ